MKTMKPTKEVSSHRAEKRVKSHGPQRSASRCQRKTEGGLETGLVNLWSRQKITKSAHAGHGQETKWGMSVKSFLIAFVLAVPAFMPSLALADTLFVSSVGSGNIYVFDTALGAGSQSTFASGLAPYC